MGKRPELNAPVKDTDIKLMCPHCKNTQFQRTESARVDIVEIIDMGKYMVDNVISSSDTGYEYKCIKCGEIVPEEELVRG